MMTGVGTESWGGEIYSAMGGWLDSSCFGKYIKGWMPCLILGVQTELLFLLIIPLDLIRLDNIYLTRLYRKSPDWKRGVH